MLFDDSTTGLDPVISATVDDEIVKLRDLEEVTSIVVTQQIRDACYIATHKTVAQQRRAASGPRARDRSDARRVHGAARGAASRFRARPPN